MNYNKWFDAYKKWQLACVEELKQLKYEGILFDSDDSNNNNIEICEDGCIHFRGNFYLTDKLVTAWEDSEFYMELKNSFYKE